MKVTLKHMIGTMAVLFMSLACNNGGFVGNSKKNNAAAGDGSLTQASADGDATAGDQENAKKEQPTTKEGKDQIDRGIEAKTSQACVRLKPNPEEIMSPAAAVPPPSQEVPGWGGGATVDTGVMMLCRKDESECMVCEKLDKVITEKDPEILKGADPICRESMVAMQENSNLDAERQAILMDGFSSRLFLNVCRCDKNLMCATESALETVAQ